jgi:single-strand DNA-binding protein
MNITILSGRLCANPEVRYISETQMAVATFTLAVDKFVNKEKKADFIRITVFGKQAENCERYLAKGKRAMVQGKISTGSYTDKDGKTVYTTDVIADRVEFIDFGEKAAENANQSATNSNGDYEVPQGFAAIQDEDIPF